MLNPRALLLLALAASLTACATAPLKPQPSSTDLYLRGQAEAEHGDLDAAIASLSAAIEKNPNLGLAYVARGQAYKEKTEYQKAADDFLKATSLEPYNFNAHYQLGLMYQYLRRFSDAIAAYQKAVEIRPMDPDANTNLALAYTAAGQPLRGLPYAQRAVEAKRDAANSYVNLGVLYSQIGKTDAAIDALKHALELNSRQPEVYLNLGQAYITQGKYDQARQVLQTARELAPAAAISERLGLACYKLHDLPAAREAFADAVRQNPNYYPALNGLGVVAMTESQAATPPDLDAAREALAFWDRSLKIEPNQPAIQQLVTKYTTK